MKVIGITRNLLKNPDTKQPEFQIRFHKMFPLKDFITNDFGCNMLYAKRKKEKLLVCSAEK